MTPTRMPLKTASTVTFFYALGYPIGNMAVNEMSPMAVLVFRFGLAALILGSWARIARVAWPTGRKLGHVAVTGLLMQAVQFCALYLAIEHGAPAVLCAVIVAMNPGCDRAAGRDVPARPVDAAPDPGTRSSASRPSSRRARAG